MKSENRLIAHIADLIGHAKDLHYLDRDGTRVGIHIQPLAKLDRLNADPANARKLAECGAANAILIGSDEHGVPILIDGGSLKAYLLDPTAAGRDYLKHGIAIVY